MTTLDLDALERGLEGVPPGPWCAISSDTTPASYGVFAAHGLIGCAQVAICPRCEFSAAPIIAEHIARCYPDTIRELVRLARLGLEAEKGWQPIETAPRMDRVLLGWWQDDGRGQRDWCSEVAAASWGWRRGSISNMSQHGQATHWRPLPTPPAGGE